MVVLMVNYYLKMSKTLNKIIILTKFLLVLRYIIFENLSKASYNVL
jgi:hypothetical protein